MSFDALRLLRTLDNLFGRRPRASEASRVVDVEGVPPTLYELRRTGEPRYSGGRQRIRTYDPFGVNEVL